MSSLCSLALLLAVIAAGMPFQALAQAPSHLAQAQLSAEDIFWQSIQKSNDAAMYQAYLEQVEAGRFSGVYKTLAELRIASLKSAASAPKPEIASRQSAPGRAVIISNTDQTAAASADMEACDRAAGAAADLEKPAGVPGVTFTEIDVSAAIRACRKVVESAAPPRRAYFQLGRSIHRSGNVADAVAYHRKAVELGHAGAMHDLATILRRGAAGVKRDPGLALALYERAAAAGLNESLVQIGAMYADGIGVRRDYAKARDFYLRAAAANTPGAYTNLGVLYANGQGVPRDRTKACEYWREGSTLGDDAAAKNLRRSCRMR